MAQKLRFPYRVACNVSAEVGEAFERLAQGSGNLTESDFMRAAFDAYLRGLGALSPPQSGMHPAE